MNLALFDFDGTITFEDSFVPFLHYAVSPARLALGKVLMLPVVIGYKMKLISPSHTRATLVSFGFRGRAEKDVREVGRTFAETRLPAMVREKALERIQWHKDNGDKVVVVSAAPNVYLEYWCENQGLEVICTQLACVDGKLTGKYLDGDCTGEEKVRRICNAYELGQYNEIYAYGDTKEDEAMLKIATQRYYRWQELGADSFDLPGSHRVDTHRDR